MRGVAVAWLRLVLECEQPRGCGLLACGSWGSAACCGLVGLVPRVRLAAGLFAAVADRLGTARSDRLAGI